jgi:glycosyltransferase involved in cell wall biosynthesis
MKTLRIAGHGKVSDPDYFGGWPYFIWQTLAGTGLNVVSHDLKRSSECRFQRIAWAARQLAHGGGPRGYMFSNEFLEASWAASAPIASGDGILNIYQLYPESLLSRAEQGDVLLFYYLDLSLRELFEEWMPASGHKLLSDRQIASAITRERRGYATARKIITMSRRTAEGIATRYQIDPRKIVTIVPGAGIRDEEIDGALCANPPAAGNDFLVGFIGEDYKRKGLLKLAAAVEMARQSGAPIKLRVIGADPPELRGKPGVELVGYVNKRLDMRRFIELVATCQLGCLLSSSEGLGISLLEFLRLGVPIVASRIEGTREIVRDEFGILVEPSASVEEAASLLKRLARDEVEYGRLCDGARLARDWASWRRAGADLCTVILTEVHR